MKNYGVVKGRAEEFVRDSDSDPHSELLIDAGGTTYRAAINVRSSRGPAAQRLVEYLILDDVADHPLVARARALPLGWSNLKDGRDDGAAIDYVRSNLFRAEQLKPLVHDASGPNNDLFEKIEALLGRAIADPRAVVYAFGEAWGPESKADQYFGFLPGRGVHDIHMNQGDRGGENGVFQDGALFVELAEAGTMSALFIKFQNQSWHTDDRTGAPLEDAPSLPAPELPDTGGIPPWNPVPQGSPYHLARIVGALLNPRGPDVGAESVTVFNTSPGTLSVDGWSIVDARGQREALSGAIPLGEARTFRLSGRGAQLSNDGGTITLLDARGLKVDGVSYTKAMAQPQGAAVSF